MALTNEEKKRIVDLEGLQEFKAGCDELFATAEETTNLLEQVNAYILEIDDEQLEFDVYSPGVT